MDIHARNDYLKLAGVPNIRVLEKTCSPIKEEVCIPPEAQEIIIDAR